MHATNVLAFGCVLLGGCFLSSERGGSGGADPGAAGQGGGALSAESVEACDDPGNYFVTAPTGCAGGPDPYLRELATCFGCEDGIVQVRVGNAGDVGIPRFDIEVTDGAGVLRRYTIEEALPPGGLSAIYAVGTPQDETFRVLSEGRECDRSNNAVLITNAESVCR